MPMVLPGYTQNVCTKIYCWDYKTGYQQCIKSIFITVIYLDLLNVRQTLKDAGIQAPTYVIVSSVAGNSNCEPTDCERAIFELRLF